MKKDQRDIIADLWVPFLEKQKGSALLWYVVAMGIGIAWYFSLNHEPNHLYLYGATGIAGGVAFALRHQPIYRIVSFTIMMAVIGASLSAWRTDRLSTTLLHKDLRGQTVIGTVVSYEPAATGWRVVLQDLEFEKLKGQNTPQKIRITIRQKGYQPAYQQRLSVYAKVMSPSAPIVPGVYDFQRHAFFQGLGGYGFALGDPEILSEGQERGGIITAIRQSVSDKILNSQPQPTSGVVAALLTGQRKTIRKSVSQDLRNAGLAHLLAISGLHVGLLAGIIFYFIRMGLVVVIKPTQNWPIKKISAFIALLGAVAYMLMVGSPVSTQRAVIMTGLVLLAVMTDRRAITLRLVGIAAFIVLVLQPGFQMSFSAVIGLVAFYRASEPLWMKFRFGAGWIRKFLLYLAGVTMTTVIATLSTAPFALYHFQQISIYGFIANMLAMPIMAFWVMPAGVLSYLTMIVGFEYIPLAIMGQGVTAIRIIAEWVANMDGSIMRFTVMPIIGLATLSAGFIFLCFIKGRWRLVGLIPLCIGGFIALSPPMPIAMINGSGRIMGYVPEDPQAYLLLSNKGDRFTTKLLQQLAGRADITPWKNTMNIPDLKCDDWGCIAHRQNQTIAFVEHPAALERDCKTADIILAPFPVSWECEAWVIDKFDVWRHGGHILYPDGKNRFKIIAVNKIRGFRPWTDKEKPRYKHTKKTRD